MPWSCEASPTITQADKIAAFMATFDLLDASYEAFLEARANDDHSQALVAYPSLPGKVSLMPSVPASFSPAAAAQSPIFSGL